jgi:hypothetical protein
MKMRVLASILLVLALGSEANAQIGDYFFGFAYTPVLPTGNSTDLVGSSLSFRGATMEGRKVVKDNVTVGFSAGWQVMNYETGETLQPRQGIDVTGFQFRYINNFPILFTAHYYFGRRGDMRPYIGGGAGISYLERRMEVGLYLIDQDGWPITLAPEIGVAFPAGWRAAGFGFVRWYWMASAGGAPSLSYLSFGLGIAWQ